LWHSGNRTAVHFPAVDEGMMKNTLYTGDFYPLNIGDVVFDASPIQASAPWVVRVAKENAFFPCGEECCGVAEWAVEAYSTEAEALARASEVV